MRLTKITPAVLAVALAAMPQIANAQSTAEGGVVARQVRVPIEKVLGGDVKPTDEERDALAEQKRHNRAVERELRRMRKNNPFVLGAGARKQPKRVRSLPANSNRY